MSEKLVYFICFAVVSGSCPYARADLVAHWKLDDGQGKIASDSSGHGHDGVFSTSGAPAWVAGKLGGALEFHGKGEYVQYTFPEAAWAACTVAVWAKVATLGQAGYSVVFSNHTPNAAGFQIDVDGGNPGNYRVHPGSLLFGTVKTDWVHLTVTSVGTAAKLYYNGTFVRNGTLTDMLFNKFALAVARSGTSGYLACTIDDLRVYDNALTEAEIQDAMNGVGTTAAAASTPSPADQATDVPRDTVLDWKPGKFATTHDVYFGTVSANVTAASRTDPQGVLVGQGQEAHTYDPGSPLGFGQTCYWRIDEVNAPPTSTVFKGSVWSFTVEPYAYSIPGPSITATASSAQAGMGPENTINGSGLNANDEHSTDAATMWVSTGGPSNWIQYVFDRPYQLQELWVWNSNQLIEPVFGLGAKGVTVEYSLDGGTWTVLSGVPEFARAPGAAGYGHSTVVSLGGALARYVKLTINTTWGGNPQTSLSEVRFFYVPVQARAPQPAAGATGVSLDTGLNWRPGREAASHRVYLSTDRQAVTDGTAPVQTVTGHSLTPASLQFGTTYYWRVDEVNDAAATKSWAGDVWSFTIREFAVVDDFESYDEDNRRIYETWIDGATDGRSGSYVGYNPTAAQLAAGAHFAERAIVHGGQQSMPVEYNNVATPFYSETTRTFDTPQDWTGQGATHLSLWYRGYPAPTGLAVDESGGKMTLTGDGTDIWGTSDDFVFAYKTLTGDGSLVARVASVGTGTNGWAKGGVMIRDSLNGGSTFVDMVLTGGSGNGASFQYRLTPNASPAGGGAAGGASDATTAVAAPYWVKIQRAGDAISGYLSATGTTWTQVGATQMLTMTAPVYIGVCVTAHQAGEQRTMQFDNVAATGGVTGSWRGARISSPRYNDPAGLYVVVADSTGQSKLMAHPDPAAAATGTWTQWTIPFNDLTAAGVKPTKVQKLTIGAGNRNNPSAGGTGMLYFDDIGFGHPAK